MEKIIIVECYSSAVNYIHDIRKLGFEPILLELYVSGSERSKIREINDRVYTYNGDELPTVIMASESYNETIIVSAEIVIAFRLKNMLGQNMPLLSIETVLTEGSIDNIAQNVTDVLIDDGIEKKQALCYRMLIEERLIALISSGHKNEKLTITLYAKPDDINVSLSVNGEETDVFAMPQAVDEVSTTLFSRVFGMLSE